MFIESPSRSELQRVVDHFVWDMPVVEIPGPGRNEITKAKGFRHINADGMFMLAMSSMETVFRKNGALRRLTRYVLGAPTPYSIISYHDIVDPSRSLSFNLHEPKHHGDDEVRVVVGDIHEKNSEVRIATSEDVNVLNRALAIIVGLEPPEA